MIELNYHDNGLNAQCQYVLGHIGEQEVVVVLQTGKSVPSITNAIETIAKSILAKHFQYAHPDIVSFYTHYPNKDALVSWERVYFQVEPIQKLLPKLFGVKPKRWQISNPKFCGIKESLKDQLTEIISK
ncbi:MAG: hypothetical protein K2X81_25995 [Candidatus Obscuribacterales bacterium]|nr:hypothetical protein [Candidatus Obscuribacterales bacterium]